MDAQNENSVEKLKTGKHRPKLPNEGFTSALDENNLREPFDNANN